MFSNVVEGRIDYIFNFLDMFFVKIKIDIILYYIYLIFIKFCY